jgi:hypothetical protein
LPGLPTGYSQVYISSDILGTGVIRYCDLQLDGKPDIAITFTGNNQKPVTKFFTADTCTDDYKSLMNIPQPSNNFDFSKCRYFRPADNTVDLIQNLTSYSVSFFDFAELGTFSFMVIQKNDKQAYYISTYYNYLNVDNYFLKSSGKTKSKDNGGTCVGCTFEMIKTEINGDKHPAVQSQQISLSNTRLSLPYIFFGLGRINNYIENFNMGVLKKGSWNFAWSPIIPNSQLFVSPVNTEVSKWKIEIFINPTKALFMIIISTGIVLLVLGLVIMYYHRQEKIKENPSDMVYNFF